MKNKHRPSVMNDIWRDQCIKMWENIVSQHEKEVLDDSSTLFTCDVYKEEALEAISHLFGEELNPTAYCFACEEAHAQKVYEGVNWLNCHDFCPVTWGDGAHGDDEDFGCGCYEYPYQKWVHAMEPESALKHARDVLEVIKTTWKTTEQFLLDRGLDPDVKAGYKKEEI